MLQYSITSGNNDVMIMSPKSKPCYGDQVLMIQASAQV